MPRRVPDPPHVPAAAAAPAATSVTLGPGLRVHAVQTGWVCVKAAHREFAGPAALRTLAIAADPRWTAWLPITAWVVEHPEGVLVVDAGETPRVADPGYFACDPGTRVVYERLLRFDVPPAAALGAQLARLGIPPDAVRWVALTHLHSLGTGSPRSVPASPARTTPRPALTRIAIRSHGPGVVYA